MIEYNLDFHPAAVWPIEDVALRGLAEELFAKVDRRTEHSRLLLGRDFAIHHRHNRIERLLRESPLVWRRVRWHPKPAELPRLPHASRFAESEKPPDSGKKHA